MPTGSAVSGGFSSEAGPVGGMTGGGTRGISCALAPAGSVVQSFRNLVLAGLEDGVLELDL